MALELAAIRMFADPSLEHALVTTGDRFAEPGFARWNCDYGVSYGDGGTAIVLGRRQGPFTLLSVTATGAPQLEEMHRGDDPFSAAARSHGPRVDVRRTKKAFLTANGSEAFARTCARALRSAIETALAEAGVLAEEISLVALPRLGYGVLEQAYLPTVTELIPAPALVMGRRTGHLGAGDAAANLVELHHRQALEVGGLALLISGGAGFSWSCLIVRAEDAA
jgi:3-oxoacyl-[acyl-carrier-protein] synthase-3